MTEILQTAFVKAYSWMKMLEFQLNFTLKFGPGGPIRSGDHAYFPPQPPGSLVIWGTEWPKI